MKRGFMRERGPGVFELRAHVDFDVISGKRRTLYAPYRGDRVGGEAALADLVAR